MRPRVALVLSSLLGAALAASCVISCSDNVIDHPPAAEQGDDDNSTPADGGSSSTKHDASTTTKADGAAGTGDDDDDDDDDDATTPTDAGMVTAVDAPVSDEIQVIVEPSDKGSALIAAINGAKKSIHLTMYLLSDSTIISALANRHSAGVEVKVTLNETFPSTGGGDTAGSNTGSFGSLKDAGVDVTWASARFTYTHEKCFIFDNSSAWIDTMNATYTARTSNREYLVPDTDPADVAEAEAIFEADHSGATIKPSGKLLVSPVSMRSGIENLIAGAKTTLQFEVEEFDDGDIASAFCAAAKRGVKTEGLLSNSTQSSTGKKTVTTLEGCGVPMKMLATPYIHAKAIVADGARAYIGSANFSPTSLDQNRELGLITTDTTAVGAVAKTVAGDISSGTSL